MKATFILEIIVNNNEGIEQSLSLYEHENGGMFAIDSSFIESLDGIDEDDDITCEIPDPFGNGEMVTLVE